MSVVEHKALSPSPADLRVALLTASDSRTSADDEGGRVLRELAVAAGFTVTGEALLREEPAVLRAHVAALAASDAVDAVLVTGGTGLGPRDRTPEALGALFERRLDGFGELFRARSCSCCRARPRPYVSPWSGSSCRSSRTPSATCGALPGPTSRPKDLTAMAVADVARGVAEDASGAGPLVDPQRRVIDYLRISVTDRCNYRCTYCIPEDGALHVARADVLSFEEIAGLARAFVKLGVRRLRLTGGEPTVRRDLPTLARLLRDIPGVEELALSTNGHLLAELAAPLRSAGVDRLNVSLDTLDADKFRRITARGDLARVRAGLAAARSAGFASIKLNTVAVKGFNDDELAALCAFAWERGFVPRFIEQMPMAAGQTYVPGALLSAAEIRAVVARAHPRLRVVADDGGGMRGAGPARYHRLVGDGEDTAGTRRFGIISPMTEHFCDRCNRARLSATGALHACLAHDDAVDLRGPLRAGGEAAVVAAIRAAIGRKRDGHDFQLVGLGGPRKAMVQIGG